jgi:hypothetical protein
MTFYIRRIVHDWQTHAIRACEGGPVHRVRINQVTFVVIRIRQVIEQYHPLEGIITVLHQPRFSSVIWSQLVWDRHTWYDVCYIAHSLERLDCIRICFDSEMQRLMDNDDTFLSLRVLHYQRMVSLQHRDTNEARPITKPSKCMFPSDLTESRHAGAGDCSMTQ